MRIHALPCAGLIPQNHFRDTVENRVPISKIKKFLPNIKKKIGEIEFLVADRIIRPHVKETDTRISEIIKMAENCYVIFQGKIDYSLNIADQMLELLNENIHKCK